MIPVLLALSSLASSPALACGIETVVFAGGEGGYPVYRIPAITRLISKAHAGRILALAEGRGNLADNGTNDIVLRTSDDAGASFGPVRVLCDLDARSLNNPCVVELATGVHAGRVLLMFQSYPEGCGEACATEGYGETGAARDTICRTLLMHSDDGGDSWSAPREVTRGVKRATRATSVATGPGIGIQLAHGPHKGRVVMPLNEGPPDRWRVYAAYSDDGGDSWKVGDPAPDGERGVGNEVQMFERTDGSVVLNCRQHLGAKRRKTAVSTDGGATWSPLVDVPELPDPTCMAGVLALSGDRVVFTGCDSESRRALGAAWFSDDGGRTWPTKVQVEPEGFAYSVPVMLDATRIGVLYEAAGYKRIVLREISVPAPSGAAKPAAH